MNHTCRAAYHPKFIHLFLLFSSFLQDSFVQDRTEQCGGGMAGSFMCGLDWSSTGEYPTLGVSGEMLYKLNCPVKLMWTYAPSLASPCSLPELLVQYVLTQFFSCSP